MNDNPAGSVPVRGVAIIAAHLATLPEMPGVYRMLAADGTLLYVGKAKSLRKRVAAYTKLNRLPERIRRMVTQTTAMEFATTHTEAEALLLEANMIKRLKPRYNVILRDDKSFPYILLSSGHAWPQILKHRGARSKVGEYFGPFASAGAVNRTLAVLQRAFPLRSCSDADFATRTRPCLQYQIKRCSAPCVGRIAAPAYQDIVSEVRRFLAGESHAIQEQLSKRMLAASDARDFEAAAIFRDRIRAMTQIQAHQDINIGAIGEADVMAVAVKGGMACVQVFFFRAGQNFGNRAYFPSLAGETSMGELLGSFIGQFYDSRPAPKLILVDHPIANSKTIAEALSVSSGHRVDIQHPQRGIKRSPVDHAAANARDALERRMAENTTQRRLLEGVAEVFTLPATPERIEIYDNSHIQGSYPVGAMVVAGPEGLMKSAYRKFNIKDKTITPGDDYAMMREVLTRRFRRLTEDAETEKDDAAWPDLILIDGGQGQLSAAEEVMHELNISDVALVGIAKGPDRDAGRERFFMTGRQPFSLEQQHPVLYFLQRLRDEAHRFAIGAHRARRSKAIGQSTLDDVPGIGARRKKALLLRFGSAKAVAAAGLVDLEQVDGISKATARAIYDYFHGAQR